MTDRDYGLRYPPTPTPRPTPTPGQYSNTYSEPADPFMHYRSPATTVMDVINPILTGGELGLKQFSWDVKTAMPQNLTSYFEQLRYSNKLLGASKIIGVSAPIINIGVGAYNASEAYQNDIASGSRFLPETMKSVFGTAGSLALGAAAVGIAAGAGLTLAPAAALIIGAGYAGNAIGEQLGLWGNQGLNSWFS